MQLNSFLINSLVYLLFLAALGLHCGPGSSLLPQGFLQLSCMAFSFLWFLLLPSTAFGPEDSVVVALQVSYSGAHGILAPGPEMECSSPPQAGQFLPADHQASPIQSFQLSEPIHFLYYRKKKKKKLRVNPKSSHHKEKKIYIWQIST